MEKTYETGGLKFSSPLGRMPSARLQRPSPGFRPPPSTYSDHLGDIHFRENGSDQNPLKNRNSTDL